MLRLLLRGRQGGAIPAQRRASWGMASAPAEEGTEANMATQRQAQRHCQTLSKVSWVLSYTRASGKWSTVFKHYTGPPRPQPKSFRKI